MNTLEHKTAIKIRDMILKKELPYSILEKLPCGCKEIVEHYLREHDKAYLSNENYGCSC